VKRYMPPSFEQAAHTATRGEVLSLWKSLAESASWGEVDWSQQCVDRPELARLNEGGELYAVIHILERRVVPEEEFPSCDMDQMDRVACVGSPKWK
jgi:hypothetical protein